MSTRSRYLLAAGVLLATLWFAMPGFTGATYTTTTSNGASSVTAAADWTPPVVSMTSPASIVNGTVTVAATASDATSGVASVAIQYLATGGSGWTTICTDTTTPYTCSWDTTAVADGGYSLRAVAIDKATPANTATSSTVTTQVSNTPVVTMTDPGRYVSGNVAVSAAVTNYGSKTISSLKIQVSPTGTNSWMDVPGCSTASATLSCTASTAGITGKYDARAIAVVAGTTYTDIVTNIYIDNTAPTATMTSPGSPIKGTVSLASTAGDADSGVASVAIQYAASGSSTWTTVCTDTTSPYTCSFNTTSVSDGDYQFRSIATDQAGNATTSATVTSTVTNAALAVSLANPGSWVSGSVNLTAAASATKGVKNVAFQYAPSGSSTWTTICTDTTSPYSCSWSTTARTNGDYQLRAVLTDTSGATLNSSVVNVSVDNTALAGYNISAVNKTGGQQGRVESGDQIVYTYNGQVDPSTVLTGWDGTSKSVSVVFTDGYKSGTGSDAWAVTNTNLGTVSSTGDFITTQKAFTLTGTMVASTATVNGNTASVITITLTSSPASGDAQTAGSGTLTWVPSSAVKNYVGTASATTATTERGGAHTDF